MFDRTAGDLATDTVGSRTKRFVVFESTQRGRARRSRKRPQIVIVASALIFLVSGGVASSLAWTRTATQPVLRIGIPGSQSNDPAKTGGGIWFTTVNSIAYAAILNPNPNGTFSPGLATSWRWVPTRAGRYKLFEFTLRQNARFSDGNQVTARAAAGWLNYYFANSIGKGLLGPKPKAEAIGRLKVRIQLTLPIPDLPLFLSGNLGDIASPKAVANPALFGTQTYGAGPYMLDPSRTVTNDHYTFVPNPYYYDKAAIKFRQVNVKVITVASSMLQALQAGQLDLAYGDPTTNGRAESSGFRVAWAPCCQLFMVMSPDLAPQLADLRVRQALNYALDRKVMVRAILGKYGGPTSEILVTDADPGLRDHYAYNPTKARSLLAAAGYAKGFNLKFVTLPSSFLGYSLQVAQAAAKYFDAVGIKTDVVVPATLAEFLQLAGEQGMFLTSGTIDSTPARWSLVYNPVSKRIGASYTSSASGIADPLARLYYVGLHKADPVSTWKELWKGITQRALFVPVSSYPASWYSTKSVRGVNVTTQRFGSPLVLEIRKA